MRSITSLNNPEIKHIVRLHIAKARKEHNQTFAEGLRTITTLKEAGIHLDRLYITEEQREHAYTLNAHDTILVSPEVMAKISAAVTPSGLLAIFTPPQPRNLAQLTSGLVLAQINDPGNMGTLIRTAAACAVRSVIIVEGTDPWSPKVIQSSAGTIGLVKLFMCTWNALVGSKRNLQLCALVVSGGSTPRELTQVAHTNLLLVVGNEAQGLPLEWQKQCDLLLSLPMPGGTESLNAAVAGSLALYFLYVLY
ncbi:RNA methyltransferase [Candidatus Dependentiae bacterium]|nr:RNA methyltransferase [Candidatus Dependentiae bacterium]